MFFGMSFNAAATPGTVLRRCTPKLHPGTIPRRCTGSVSWRCTSTLYPDTAPAPHLDTVPRHCTAALYRSTTGTAPRHCTAALDRGTGPRHPRSMTLRADGLSVAASVVVEQSLFASPAALYHYCLLHAEDIGPSNGCTELARACDGGGAPL